MPAQIEICTTLSRNARFGPTKGACDCRWQDGAVVGGCFGRHGAKGSDAISRNLDTVAGYALPQE